MSDLGWLFNLPTLQFLGLGFLTTLGIALCSIAISLALGILLALARLSSNRAIGGIATFYIETMRALPVLLVISFAYFALPGMLGIKLSPFAAGVIAMSTFTAALIAEIVRAGLRAVPAGLVEAAAAQGFSGAQTLRLITLPIALRQMMPALVAQFVTLLKDTSLTAIVGVLDLLRRAQIVSSQPPFQPLPVFALVAVVYFTVNFGLGRAGRRLEA